ncbi:MULTISPECIES: toxin-antitoxin system HicB family antitoxin [Mycobacteroides]|jgi:HicB family|uniref:Histidine kinase n=1 Tax=Mycobacteroides chelonae TaxID=1774 RepID=A0A1S1LYP3_MYCCH|nr:MULTISPECIES: toxin-antitoxin system HicB family antitoxin [Mycobacteroides]KRQ22968.1 hisitidine kinase [Mycobacteroides sp. H003]KRQ33780.1 hisitidine kinase [Mycobacteroides sp. H092]KRQ39703.1 hisitidine kinase [Mycobacteroides sp. H101]KRQ46391.1 hisitidine kinase [Mycobacteroides sp. H063]KRQ63426.1 hisitidine kinase [Mycobacteroides sp. HXVII]
MDLQPYVDSVRRDLAIAAKAGGAEAEELADRLTAPLESAIRLALLDALSAAAEHITRELAPASVDLRLRGREPEFVVSRPVDQQEAEPAAAIDESAGTWRVTLRLPESLRAVVEAAAGNEGISLNSWLVRATAAAAKKPSSSTVFSTGRTISGWVR